MGQQPPRGNLMEFTGKSRAVKKPLNVRVVLVRPEYQINLGLICRAMKNFNAVDLALVSPAQPPGPEAYKFAKHSQEILHNAKVYRSLKEATKGFELVIGTTGVLRRFRGNLKNCISTAQLPEFVNGRKVALVFGSEGIGLTDKELSQCDVIAHIPTGKAHPVLNLSHAVAVTLYAAFFSRKTGKLFKTATRKEVEYLNVLFSQIVDEIAHKNPKLRDVAKTKLAFRRILGRARVAETESQTLFAALGRIRKALKTLKKSPKYQKL